jgi:hypothetical protein
MTTSPHDALATAGVIDISISPVWTIRHHGERQFDLLLLTLLQAIQENGRLTDCARECSCASIASLMKGERRCPPT